jgi:acetolactate synthase-1/2/3 large subunit
MAAREVFEEKIKRVEINRNHWKPLAPSALSRESVAEIRDALVGATMPVIVTTYLGKDRAAVKELVTLAELLGIAVVVWSIHPL